MLLVQQASGLTLPDTAERYLLIGPTPPPFGGISVYLSRLVKKLQREGNTVVVVDRGSQSLLRTIAGFTAILLYPGRLSIQLHSFDFTAMALMILRPFPKRLQYMDHNTAVYKRDLKGLRRALFSRILSSADEVIFVGEKTKEYYRSEGFTLAPHVEFRSPFLPPHLDDEPGILATYSHETRRFIETRSPLLVANASAILFYDGIDLYGLDMCVNLTARLKADHPDIGFIFAIANSEINADYVQGIQKRVRSLGLEENFHFILGQREIWPIFRHSALMVRPTCNDGYGVSLAEALSFGSSALASDVTGRPPKTEIFRSRDEEDFYMKASLILRERRENA